VIGPRSGMWETDVSYAIDGYADDMQYDLIYSVERELEHEAEAQDPA
jgi:hypothetical protein